MKVKRKRIELTSPDLAVVRYPGKKGLGVCARKTIRKGSLIERAPVFVIPGKQKKHIEKTVLWDHWFDWGCNGQNLAIALGFGSLYNHSYDPNAMCYSSERPDQLEIVALRNIKRGEEITINYHGAPDDNSPVWFECES